MALKNRADYIAQRRGMALDKEGHAILNHLAHFTRLTPSSRLLEIGCGMGWFEVFCYRQGIKCRGIEIDPELVRYARSQGNMDVEQGDITQIDLGIEQYDVAVACSVLEHVKDWHSALATVYRSLRSGGLLYFVSTNGSSLFPSGESTIPFYGWLPRPVRHWMMRKHKAIWGDRIEWNEFHYYALRNYLRQIGFREVHSFMEYADAGEFRGIKARAFRFAQSHRSLWPIGEIFGPVTMLIAVKGTGVALR